MMKNTVKLTALAGLVAASQFSSFAAQAGNIATLTIKGQITPGSCSINLGSGGVIDYGNIRPDVAKASYTKSGDVFVAPKKSVDYNVSCDSAIRVAMTIAPDIRTNNYNGSGAIGDTSANVSLGSLGLMTDGTAIGYSSVSLANNVTADGADVMLISTADGGVTWTVSADGGNTVLDYTLGNSAMVAVGDTSGAKAVTNWSGSMNVYAAFPETVLDSVSGEEPFDTNYTFTLHYL